MFCTIPKRTHVEDTQGLQILLLKLPGALILYGIVRGFSRRVCYVLFGFHFVCVLVCYSGNILIILCFEKLLCLDDIYQLWSSVIYVFRVELVLIYLRSSVGYSFWQYTYLPYDIHILSPSIFSAQSNDELSDNHNQK